MPAAWTASAPGLGDRGAGDARAHRGGHGGGPGQRDPGVVRDHARCDHAVDQGWQIPGRRDDADRRDAHRGAVGGAGRAGLVQGHAGQDGGDGALGGGAEEIEGAAFGHVALPLGQRGREFVRVDRSMVLDQEPGQQHGLLGVVGDRPGEHAPGDVVTGRGGLEAGQERPPAIDDRRAGEHLGGHAESVADRQPVQRPPGARCGFHDHEGFSSLQREVEPSRLGEGYRTCWPYISPRGSARSSRRAPSGSRK